MLQKYFNFHIKPYAYYSTDSGHLKIWGFFIAMVQFICKQKAPCYQHEAQVTLTVAALNNFKTALPVKA
jgi:hypothetical protein